jgi:hypothetical protein
VRILFDADSMVYAVGFASQKTVYDWTATDGKEIVEGFAKSNEDLAAVLNTLPAGWEGEAVPVVEPEPVENALALAKRQILRIEKKLETDGYAFDGMELYITGKGNHRDEIATIKPYKGNRLALQKPAHYGAIRRYLMSRWHAVKVDGWEADDEVAAVAAVHDYDPARVMIVSQDKDLRTVPGLLYNYNHDRYELITHNQALVNFYRQIITGDPTDNIGGCFKAGAKVAEEVIKEGMSEEEMWCAVLRQFEESLKRKGCPYTNKCAHAAALEMGQLLHLSRFRGDIWIPPL